MELATGYPGYNSLMPKGNGTFAEVLRQNGVQVESETGCRVTLKRRILRLSWPITKKQYSTPNVKLTYLHAAGPQVIHFADVPNFGEPQATKPSLLRHLIFCSPAFVRPGRPSLQLRAPMLRSDRGLV